MRGALWVTALLLSRAHLSAQAPPDVSLVQAQALMDAGKSSEAEAAVRTYLKDNADSADAHYLLGYILFREGNPKASLAEYLEGARRRPPTSADYEAMASDYFLMEDYSAADQWFTKAVELNPGDAQAQYFLGRAKYNEQRFDEAVHAFQKCLTLNSQHVKAMDYLGLAYEATGRTENAMTAYRSAIEAEVAGRAKDAGPYLHLGALLTANDRASDALALLLEAVQIAPQDWNGHRELGKAYLALNRLEAAQAALEQAAKLAPENAPIHFLLAQVYRRRGLSERARSETQRYTALTASHSSPETPLSEARALLDLGKLAEAEQVMRHYVEEHVNSAEGHYLLGYILFKKQDAKASLAEYTQGAKYRTPDAAALEVVAADYVLLKDYPDADKWFTKAVQWNPQDSLGWYYLGRTKYSENRFEEAVSAFQHCLQLDPKNIKAEDNMGLAYEGLNQTEKALAAYRTAIAWQWDSPVKNPGPIFDLGALLVDTDHAAEAMPYLLEAARLSPRDYRVHRQLAKAYKYANDFASARAELEQAVALAPRNASLHFMLAQIYRKQGMTEKARSETEQYTRLAGTNSSEN